MQENAKRVNILSTFILLLKLLDLSVLLSEQDMGFVLRQFLQLCTVLWMLEQSIMKSL